MTVGNEFLADYARRRNQAVSIVPSSIELADYSALPESQDDKFVVCWTGSVSTLVHFEHARPALEQLARLVPLVVKIICSNPPGRPVAGAEMRFVEWSAEREASDVADCHAGIMMIRPYSPVAAGTRLSVELKQGDCVSGVAQWSDKGLVGITFDEQIDVLALLNSPGGKPRPRMPRIELNCTTTLRQDGTVFRARVVNISQGGICVNSPVDLELNGDVIVSLPDLHSAAGVVKWRDGDYYGIGFNRVYPVNELMAFLQEQQREEQQRKAVA